MYRDKGSEDDERNSEVDEARSDEPETESDSSCEDGEEDRVPRGKKSDGSGRSGTVLDIDEQKLYEIPLEPLDLVWAKCRGYPWYPALIIDPESNIKSHNGVVIPVPPPQVLTLRPKQDRANRSQLFLVLFFDVKRTWQWLPRSKLVPLGPDADTDKKKLQESKKASERKAVKKAYEDAIAHRCRVAQAAEERSMEH